MSTEHKNAGRLLAFAITGVIALVAVAGCGGSSESTSESAGSAKSASPRSSSDEQEIESVYGDFVRASYLGPPQAICAAMTERAKRILGVAGPEATTSCLKLFTQTLADRKTGTASYPKPTVLGVAVKGDNAVARVKTGDGTMTRVRFARSDGQWKVDGGT